MRVSLLLPLVSVLGCAAALEIGSVPTNHHAVQITNAVKRNIPAEVEVADSNTVPIEDLQALGSTVGSASSGGSLADSAAISASGDGGDGDNAKKSAHPFFMSISMILVSEIGDKTFLISALMAMRHSRMVVFTASFASLALMTVLSGIVGHALPTLLSQRVTQFLASGLFLVFGAKLTKEGLAMSKDLGVDEELAEVEEEIQVTDMNLEMNDMESGRQHAQVKQETWQIILAKSLAILKSISTHVFSPLWVQVFIMVFLGEWGDRSQIATIAMAAGSDYWIVIIGAILGHMICTLAAVIGGKMIASRISMRTVTLGGAFAFFVFSILYFLEAMYSHQDE